MNIFDFGLTLGDFGVTIAQLITSINPASWWASGILTIIKAGLEAAMNIFA